jgi:hypothetical protein
LGDQNIERIATVTNRIMSRDVMVTLDGSDDRYCMAPAQLLHWVARGDSVTERKNEHDWSE